VNPRFLASRRAPRAELLEALTDEQLAELTAQGQDAAFEVLVARYRRALINHCAQLLGRADAEEAVQEALLRAYLALSRGHSVQRVGAWLWTIAHNTALNLLRTRGARPMGGVAELPTETDPFERREHLRLVVEAVGSLPDRQREALVMRELEGRSYAEIESRLRTSNGAVRQLLNRARAGVRARLGTLAGIEPALRWFACTGGAGSSAARIGALTGGCVTVKLCASALIPATLSAGALFPAPTRHAAVPSHPARRAVIAARPVSQVPARAAPVLSRGVGYSSATRWSGAGVRQAASPTSRTRTTWTRAPADDHRARGWLRRTGQLQRYEQPNEPARSGAPGGQRPTQATPDRSFSRTGSPAPDGSPNSDSRPAQGTSGASASPAAPGSATP
jgi:RNA polymerase sigma factor (sigma-70 family)